MTDTEPRTPSYTVVYDGTCRVCVRIVTALRRWDRNNALELLPSQTAGLSERFPWIPLEAYTAAMQVIGPGGQTWEGAAAIEELLNVLPKGRLVGWLFRIPIARVLADRFYKWFARNRFRLGCGKHCAPRGIG